MKYILLGLLAMMIVTAYIIDRRISDNNAIDVTSAGFVIKDCTFVEPIDPNSHIIIRD